MPIMKAKDDGEMFDVPDNERDAALATGKFDEFYRVKAKDDGEEFIIPSQEITDAMKSGKFEFSEQYDQRKKIAANPTKPQLSKLQSAALGAGNAMSFGFADEIIGGLGGDKQGIRGLQDEAKDQNPWSYGAGSVLGGIASPSIVGSAGKTLVTAIGKGALAGGILGGVQGVGENVNREELAGDALKGAALGTVLGGVGGAIGRGAQALTKSGRADLGNEYKAFKQGFTESKPEVLPGINQAKKIWDGVKETLESSKAQEELFNFLKGSKLNTVSRMVEDGSIPKGQEQSYLSFLNKLSDEEYILAKLQEGDPEVSGWIARQAGGNTEAKQRFLAMRPEERQALRSMDLTQESKDLNPLVDPAKKAIFKDAGKLFEKTKAEAANNFDPTIGNVIDASRKTAENFANMSDVAGGGTLNYFKQAEKIIKEGVGDLENNFTKNAGYGEVSQAEQYQRLLNARKILSTGIEWSADKKQSPIGEKFLREYRDVIDKALKETPSQVEADKAWSTAEDLNDLIFKNVELGGGADPYKLKRAFGNTDQANRLRDGLERLQEFANTAKDPDVRQKSQAFLDQFNKIFDKKQNSDALNQLQREGGPSALAIQRLQRSMRGDDKNILQSAIKETPDFLLTQESRAANMQKVIGKAYKDMTLPEKTAFNRVYLKIEKQGGIATDEAIKNNFGLELEKASKIK